MLIMGEMILRNARLFPRKTAFIQGERTLSFGDFAQRVQSLMRALSALGIRPGDRVAVLAANCIEYFELYGLADMGAAILVPLNYRLQVGELEYLLQDSGSSILFFSKQYRETADELKSRGQLFQYAVCLDEQQEGYLYYEELIQQGEFEFIRSNPPNPPNPHIDYNRGRIEFPVKEDDAAYILYTSGTTGLPRGAVLTHRGQYQTANALALEMSIHKEDVTLDMMPLYHTGGHAVALAHFYRGCTSVIMTGFNPREALELVAKHGVTTMQVVPAMIVDMLNQPDLDSFDTSSLRMIFYASSPMPEALLRRSMERWGRKFFQAYGLTENGPVATVLTQADHVVDGSESATRKLKSCGLPSANCDTRVWKEKGIDVKPGEIGEIVIRSEQVMKGYWGLPELTAQTLKDGWLYTGDLATVDEEGYIYIVDRKKDMIISGGENVYPREVEEIIYQHPAVYECAVVGIPNVKWVESVHALVVLKKDASLSEQELIAYCKSRLAPYKAPKSVEFVSELPKNPSGKILKKELRSKYWSPAS
ncbi:class I adenylate-forming enzyme family protein [Paradesulfitobacterium ferrireducens]|uniref:class I adenylate-forming enzyme family protein n=1 Tax=Paradesulfitobacterium ferrireducens TaxID=2816476 RepID=UPI001A8CEC31|nr:long-chain fatty acid--CoA ligase [Paradesulfitobacterium ferrireducens]